MADTEMIPVSRPDLGQREADAVARVIESQWVGMGPVTAGFEQSLQQFLDVPHVVATSNGTAALHLALSALDRDARDEVILPSLTFAASVQAVLMAGYRPVFAEVDLETLTLSPTDVAGLIGHRTRAIMPVHFAGLTCGLEELERLAMAADLAMIEDAAHAFGNRRQPRSATQVPNAVCYSFSANKNITCGEGGAVATSDPELARRVRAARYLGIDDDTWSRRDFDRPWSYQVLTPGYRYHLSDMHAAIGLQQLERLDEFRERRCALAVRYDATCARLDFVRAVTRRLPEEMPHLYVARIVGGLRDVVYHWLKLRGIQCGVHYVPNHLQPAFRAFYRPLPDTERLANELISLPLHTALTDADQDRVIQALTDFAPSRDAGRPTHPDESHCVGASVR